jgi:[ribosomal protein S5]-alanine N-acetyltransferase
MEMMLGMSSSILVQSASDGFWQPQIETVSTPPAATVTTSDWRRVLPVLHGTKVALRELRAADAASLLLMLTTEEVARFVSPPPTTIEEFQSFIEWTHRKRREGQYACFAVVPEGMDTAVGIFQLRPLETGFRTAEWGFALGSRYWGTGAFQEGATLALGFAFEHIRVRRLEARCVVQNERANAALRKTGAAPEGILRESFLKDGRHHDQLLWSLLANDWRQVNGLWAPRTRGLSDHLAAPGVH